MSCSSIYIFEESEPHINICNNGFILYLNDTGWVNVYIKLYGGGTVCKTVKVALGHIKVDFRPSDYLTTKVQIEVKDLQGNEISIPYGSGTQCGLEVKITNECNSGYIVLNPAFATTSTCSWSLPTYSCAWGLPAYDCSWSLTTSNMINSVQYGTTTITLSEPPAIRDGVTYIVNPAFEAELDAIELGAFVVTLVVDTVVVTYIGSQVVNFFENEVEIEKTCA